MENEQFTSADDSASQSASPKKKPRSKIERAIVWGGIVLLLGVTLVEGLSRRGYSKTLKTLEATAEAPEATVTLAEFEDRIKHGIPFQSRDESTPEHQITYTWPSLVRTFEMRLTLASDDGQSVVSYATADAPPSRISQPGDSYALNEGEVEGLPGEAAPAGEPPAGGGGRSRGPRGLLGQLAAEAVQAELQLTDDQKTKLTALGERLQTEFGSFRDLRDLPDDERAQRLEARQKATEAGVREILSEEQFTRASELAAAPPQGGETPPGSEAAPRSQRPSE